MKLAYRAYFATLLLLMFAFATSAQVKDARSDKDRRNTAPTVGTGGSVGGPTGLFTVIDGETLRKGEYTISAALSNYDRDPGNIDITSYPLSFQIGVSNNFELFFTTEAYRTMKVNSPRNLSGFYLPNSQVLIGGNLRSAPAIVLAPAGSGTNPFANTAVFRPTGLAIFSPYPYTGSPAGTFGLQIPFFSGPQFGFAAGTQALLGPPVNTSGAASAFPGVGSVYGSILPGIVLRTIPLVNTAGQQVGEGPSVFSSAPSYLPEAPFLNRIWADSAFNNWNIGFKWRANSVNSAIGWGLSGFYRWNVDRASTSAGFNQLQRGAGSGGNRGDIGLTAFATARLAEWANLSGNVGLVHNSSVKATYTNGTFTLLDRPDEFQAAIGVDMPVNKYFQIIGEVRALKYIGGRTPNAFENNPYDAIAGIRVFPRRWLGFGLAYRRNMNQQSDDSFSTDTSVTVNTVSACRPGFVCTPVTIPTTFSGVPPGFVGSTDPHGYIAQLFVGRRDKRATDIINQPAVVDSVNLSSTTITLPCRPGYTSRSGACPDGGKTINVQTSAHDPENDVMTYNYTVSGGRVVGSGANVTWDLAGAQTGTYTITTGVDDGCGVCGKTDTKTITIRECPDCQPPPPPSPETCRCGTLSVTGPGGVTDPGNSMTFTASYSGGTDSSVTYNWSVSAGTIQSGQGTQSITVATTSAMAGQTVTATVEIGNLCSATCPRTQSESGPIGSPRIDQPIDDEYPGTPNASNDEVKAQVDAYYLKLNGNPNWAGYIINYGTPAQIKKREGQIEKAVAFRKYDRSRFTFVNGGTGRAAGTSRFILVPPGATVPSP